MRLALTCAATALLLSSCSRNVGLIEACAPQMTRGLEFEIVSLDRVEGTLSGGQAQRVAVARALCQQARVILADEPVASLDPRAADSVLALLKDVAKNENLGVLVVLHQPELARRYADRLVGFRGGTVSFDRPPELVADEEVEALYPPGDDEH